MIKKKKLLIISTVGLIYDGITSVIMSYLETMDRSKYDIYVVGTIQVEEFFRNKCIDMDVKVIDLPNRRKNILSYMFELMKIIRTNKIDIVHVHGNSGTMAIEMLCAWIGKCKKRIAHSHNTKCNQVMADKILRPIFKVLYTDAVACGKEAGEWLFKTEMFTILPNGRNISKYKFDSERRKIFRDKLGIKNNEIAIAHVGGFYEQKNHEFLVRIYRKICEHKSNIKLFMIGDGPLREKIENESKDLNVFFTGKINDISDYLNAMDGMILPSFFEGLPLVAIEWQINGLPFVLSDTITKECIVAKNVKSLSLNDNEMMWAKVLLELIDGNDRQLMSDNSSKYLENTQFNLNNCINTLEKIYGN